MLYKGFTRHLSFPTFITNLLSKKYEIVIITIMLDSQQTCFLNSSDFIILLYITVQMTTTYCKTRHGKGICSILLLQALQLASVWSVCKKMLFIGTGLYLPSSLRLRLYNTFTPSITNPLPCFPVGCKALLLYLTVAA